MFLEDRERGEEGRDGALYACNLLSSGCYGADYDVSKLEVFFFKSQPVFLLEGEQTSHSQL